MLMDVITWKDDGSSEPLLVEPSLLEYLESNNNTDHHPVGRPHVVGPVGPRSYLASTCLAF